jgi:DNA-binding MarR family transcriptional regulator
MCRDTPQNDKKQGSTVSVDSADLGRMTELLHELLARVEGLSSENHKFAGSRTGVSSGALHKLALRIASARRARTPLFNKSMFGEPAWDMLLELFINKDYGARLSVGRLCELSGAPPTTALRWLDYLEKEKLVGREPNPTDRRTEFVEITEKGSSAMEQYLSETLHSVR